MAATDQHYRKQKTLDIVFAVSSILMLVSIFWMLYQDYSREFKDVQRKFRDVEDEVFLRAMAEKLPDSDRIKAIDKAEADLADAKKEMDKERPKHASAIRAAMREKAIAEADAQSIKADYDSTNSHVIIAQDNADRAEDPKRRDALYERVSYLKKQADDLKANLDKANQTKAEKAKAVTEAEANLMATEKTLAMRIADYMLANKVMDYSAGEIKTLGEVEDNLKKATGDLDRLAKLAAAKKWKAGDWFRGLPLIDAFASPTKIQQYTFNDLTIDYSFKQVTRYDRCTSCHLGIDRAAFDKDALARLDKVPEKLANNLKAALDLLNARKKRGEDLGFDPGDIPSKLDAIKLNQGEVTQYCAHPRLELFAEANSPHPVEKMGCTICHGGQGSATSFGLAAHTPNSAMQREEWEKRHEWELSEFWDFPMLASRFIESSCLKCHHQVTDLIRYGSKEEAPKLLRGFNLIRENGCFGCHEIAGQKSGRPVGPDLRLEPNILPLEALTPAERTAARADVLNPPGTFRKVGPSLYHLAEKTNEEWVRKWLRSPRGFRPDTKMPHFFGLSTNHPDYLAKEAPEQKDFPDAEIYAIAHYLIRESAAYLEGKDRYRSDNFQRLEQYKKDQKREADLRQQLAGEGLGEDERRKLQAELLELALTEKKKKELDEVTNRLKMAGRYALLDKVLDGRMTPEDAATQPDLIGTLPTKLASEMTDGEGNNVTNEYAAYINARQAQDAPKRLNRGNRLFREKGCLACHTHEAVQKSGRDEYDRPLPAIEKAEADFGPNLSRLRAKLGKAPGDAMAHRWVVQWILNPKVYHPRTRMPVTHLKVDEASDLADWLLSHDPGWSAEDIAKPDSKTLRDLLGVNLTKMMPKSDVERIKESGYPPEKIEEMKKTKWDADELSLAEMNDDNLEWYIGKRAINRLGCFGCHNIPGFESAKPIGTPLNDWGKKDPERLAFENIVAYVEDQKASKSLVIVQSMTDNKGEGPKLEENQEAYEQFFVDALRHHQREGFLHQKLMEPRSYDYHRPLSYDDRLRMPQFRFARGAATRPIGEETKEQADARAESQAREAVMTFVLGLLADPIPLQYVHRPTGDKLAEAKGRQVLDTFNCAGCHQVRSGVLEFKRTPEVMEQLENALTNARSKYKADHYFPDHNACAGLPQQYADRIVMHGIPDPISEDNKTGIRLMTALRFKENAGPEDDIRAGASVDELPVKDSISRSETFGGTFAELLTPYLKGRGILAIGNDTSNARSALPPPLVREGEKVQPDWLFKFLRNPSEIRPQYRRIGDADEGLVVLRMPRFNMSDEDAQALVNYFAAADRSGNPAQGVEYPYMKIAQREPGYMEQRNKDYVRRLPKDELASREKEVSRIFLDVQADTLAALKRDLPAAEALVTKAKAEKEAADNGTDATKKTDAANTLSAAERSLAKIKDDIKSLEPLVTNKDAKKLLEQWRGEQIYATDAYRLVASYKLCLQCHQVGSVVPSQQLGPPLALSAERLRPEWTLRWIAHPDRLLTYLSRMPAMFPNVGESPENSKLFHGSPLDRAAASRDLLLNFPKLADLPANRLYRPGLGGQP
jgi:mono/diheme cytochrome c family protein